MDLRARATTPRRCLRTAAAKTIFRVHDLHDCTWVVVCGQCGYPCLVHVPRRTVNVPGDCHHRQMQKQKLKTNHCGALCSRTLTECDDMQLPWITHAVICVCAKV